MYHLKVDFYLQISSVKEKPKIENTSLRVQRFLITFKNIFEQIWNLSEPFWSNLSLLELQADRIYSWDREHSRDQNQSYDPFS